MRLPAWLVRRVSSEDRVSVSKASLLACWVLTSRVSSWLRSLSHWPTSTYSPTQNSTTKSKGQAMRPMTTKMSTKKGTSAMANRYCDEKKSRAEARSR